MNLDSVSRTFVDLEDVRADGWFEQLAEEIPDFEQLCQVVGRRFVAFTFITGVRISSIAYDPTTPHTSLVDFTMGDDPEVQRMTLSDFRERLGAFLLGSTDPPGSLGTEPSLEQIRQHIGRRYLLLAPLFGIRLEAIEHDGAGDALIHVGVGDATERVSTAGLRDILHNAVRSEVARARPSAPFSIDFKKIPAAELANEDGDYDQTIALLGAWPGPLSMFLRTPQGQSLGEPERSKLVRALGALGMAYLRKQQTDWAEDVLRLGIQFGQELDCSGPLFGLLGQARLETGRYGEAVGLLRRALSLGADPAEILPDLARCFMQRQRYVAALGCLSQALDAGAAGETVAQLRAEVEAALGDAYRNYTGWLAQ